MHDERGDDTIDQWRVEKALLDVVFTISKDVGCKYDAKMKAKHSFK